MATTFDDLKRFMDDSDLHYHALDEMRMVAIGFSSEPDEMTYRDGDGDAHLQIMVRLAERGEFVTIIAPRAWPLADCPNRQAVCESAMRVQAEMKLIRFDLDREDFLQPNIEIPLEKSPMCSEQLHRGIAGVLLAVRRYDAVFRHAMETGEVDMSLARANDPVDADADITRILELGADAGGIDAIERLLGGGDAPPVES